MKALILNAIDRGFDVGDVDIAAPIGRVVLVELQASGLCHTDLLFASHDFAPTPSVLGHKLNLDDLVSRRISLREVNDGYAVLKEGSLNRVVVKIPIGELL
jgi:Zn-dependent alcohol dehydrogenase